MFLLRLAFWLSIVVLLIPGDPQSGTPAPRAIVVEAILDARDAIADLSTFCERNGDVCATGHTAWTMLTENASSGIRMLYRSLTGADTASEERGAADRGTLRPDDAAPEWRGPTAGDAV